MQAKARSPNITRSHIIGGYKSKFKTIFIGMTTVPVFPLFLFFLLFFFSIYVHFIRIGHDFLTCSHIQFFNAQNSTTTTNSISLLLSSSFLFSFLFQVLLFSLLHNRLHAIRNIIEISIHYFSFFSLLLLFLPLLQCS